MKDNKSTAGVFLNGLIFENPTFIQLLGMCPTLAVTTSVKNGLGMFKCYNFAFKKNNSR